jgi:hypothetical protein
MDDDLVDPGNGQNTSSSAPYTRGSLSLTDIWENIQAIMPRQDSTGPLPPARNAWSRKAQNIVETVERIVWQASEKLAFQDDAMPESAVLQPLLDNAAKVVESAGRSLAMVKHRDKAVQEHRIKVMDITRNLDARISHIRSRLPPPTPEMTPVFVDAEPILHNPIAHLNAISQIVVLLGTICHVVAGLRAEICEFIINSAIILVKLAMTTGLQEAKYDAHQEFTLKQLPSSLYTALSKFNIDGEATLYAVCPSCNYTHQPSYNPVSTTTSYPTHCIHRLAGEGGSHICGTALLDGQSHPIKPYLVSSFREYLVRLLANGSTEQLCDQACDEALASLRNGETNMSNIFQGEFMRTFEGPLPGKLFIDRGDKARLAFAIHVDFFNPNGLRIRGNSDSIGIISLAILNLPLSLRYRPQNLFLVGVIPGPKKPGGNEISHFIRPIVEEFQIGWERGFHISHTASSPVDGRVAEVAIVLSVNDLVAARDVSGSAGHTSHFICTRCTLFRQENVGNTDHDQWQLQDTALLKKAAEEWNAAESHKRKKQLFEKYHVRWSEFWRLPYWDPPRMLVVDTMHCLLEGLVHYHCRRVLEIDAKRANEHDQAAPAFSYSWMPYTSDVPASFRINKDHELGQISSIHRLLTRPFQTPDRLQEAHAINETQLQARLLNLNKLPLMFVCYSLDLLGNTPPPEPLPKGHFVRYLIDWVRPIIRFDYDVIHVIDSVAKCL